MRNRFANNEPGNQPSLTLHLYRETRKRYDATNKQTNERTLDIHKTNTSRSLAGNTWATNDCSEGRTFHDGGLVSGDLLSPAFLVGVGYANNQAIDEWKMWSGRGELGGGLGGIPSSYIEQPFFF